MPDSPSAMANPKFSTLVRLFVGLLLARSSALALEKCVYCRGINCQRSSYQAEEQCSDRLDACASVFEGGIVQAQGCLEGIEDSWRKQCEGPSKGVDCEICASDKCNTLGSVTAACLQCAESEDEQCVDAPQMLIPQRCPIARTGRSFCYSKLVGERLERGCSLSLSDQQDCLASGSCQLCDPLERPHCNDAIVDFNAAPDSTTESTSTESTPTTQSTATPSTDSTSTQTTPTTASPQTTPTTQQPTTASPQPTAPTAPPTTAKPNSAYCLHSSTISVIIMPLAVFIYTLHK